MRLTKSVIYVPESTKVDQKSEEKGILKSTKYDVKAVSKLVDHIMSTGRRQRKSSNALEKRAVLQVKSKTPVPAVEVLDLGKSGMRNE